jgi:site-specific DNA-methyltransferase (adenine-specific)
MKKAYESSQAGATVVCLVPSRTDTRWWHDYAIKGQIEFIRGRLKFGDAKNSAPFPSALVVFKKGNNKCQDQ